ncbi:hypothetical protein METHB2_970008 [Candidatus Methylobacter favarea]|uniref:Uncharacterized protein n=1 Tax=Candidatus Methylobacter favarea TaxID=2707345 RepID=A0A8S0WD75_9GAMM|nr:hypothetical protein METHB2_970008 [Candidatus Methylobacter favarea]
MLQMPAEATANRLHTALQITLATPVGFYGRNDMREAQTLRLMRTVGVRMLIIDEVHNLLGATARRQRELLNLLRFIGNDLRIPIVCLGIRDAILQFAATTSLRIGFILCYCHYGNKERNSHVCWLVSKLFCLCVSPPIYQPHHYTS